MSTVLPGSSKVKLRPRYIPAIPSHIGPEFQVTGAQCECKRTAKVHGCMRGSAGKFEPLLSARDEKLPGSEHGAK